MPDCLFLSHPQPRDSGDYLHRVVLPGRALARHLAVAEVQTSHPAWLSLGLQAPLLVVSMLADPAVPALMAARRQLGRPTTYEISDDFRDFPPSLPGHAFYAAPSNQALIEEAARAADLLQFSSHGLAQRYGPLNAAHTVLPNQLTDVPELPAPAEHRLREPVLGWAGSAGHLDDARQLVAWLRPWYAARRRRGLALPRLHVMAPDLVAGEFLGAGLPASARAPGSFEAYLAFLGTLDIGLAILGDTAFARGRSDGKFLEYASRGAVCVASRAGEYRHGLRDGETGLLFDGPQALHDHLDSLMDDVALRLRLRAAAHAHVRAHRTHAAAAAERARRYGALLVQVPGWGHLPRDPAGTLHSLQDPTEARFLEGTLLHRSGQLHEALQAYLDVVSTHPGFHEPWSRGSSIARRLGAQGDAGLFEQMALRAMHAQLLSS